MTRRLTDGERRLAGSIYRDAIDLDRVEIRRRKWFPFQPRETAMAPMGHIHFHPAGDLYRDDFASADLALQGLFLHEMAHVWQAQRGGRFYLPLMRHPFCRYRYTFEEGKPFHRYGIEQQAEIVRHAFLLRQGRTVPGKPPLTAYKAILPFG
ncbi:vgr related protein [Sphingomonas profundi]|uniref:vgr related protein n=1 Tax=Alterirhizorhabdus profundi TaxID=2681549 RepID=UPI0012E89F8E|nr:vgr related protein [Sphingomonas profundi]